MQKLLKAVVIRRFDGFLNITMRVSGSDAWRQGVCACDVAEEM